MRFEQRTCRESLEIDEGQLAFTNFGEDRYGLPIFHLVHTSSNIMLSGVSEADYASMIQEEQEIKQGYLNLGD
ncbi:unnamed protein product [marine sediment metagenome]|uniref:Uncharacterized protein n=1 Tax=marine sediment metagenome TaxID=412755 RepID=X0S4S5_9ZZZZ